MNAQPSPIQWGGEPYEQLSRAALIRLLQNHDEALLEAGRDGIIMNYTGRTAPWQIIRQVKPKLCRIQKKFSFGDEKAQCENEIWDGENLSAMVTLYKYRGQVDFILTDPPYNTGEDFRYNDKWDKDPNDPDLGELVPKDDGSRHSKWLRFMTPRVWMMREMLKPGGVIAICIDHRELFRLGMLMDEVFREENRIAIINWQKTTVKNDHKHVSSTTEYILVYAKWAGQAKTGMLERSAKANARFGNADNDPLGDWKQGDLAAQGDKTHPTMVYRIQSPFDGELHPPPDGRHWASEKKRMKKWLEEWGATYVERDLKDGMAKALVIKGAPLPDEDGFSTEHTVLKKARTAAQKRLADGAWPRLYFGQTGLTKPMYKVYHNEVKAGSVPTTFWVDEEDFVALGPVSWSSAESGRSREGVEELDRIMGGGHDFRTVKPLKLFKKLTQLWCPPAGIVLDPFAGSGTTGHAVMALNKESGASRRFILIEQGNTEKGDHYARTLTSERVKRAISGDWAEGKRDPLQGGFRFVELKREKIDAEAVNALAREEMIDLLLTSYWDKAERAKSYLRRLPVGQHKHLFAVSPKEEGFFLVWESAKQESVLNREVYKAIVAEAAAAKLATRYHVYASFAPYTGAGIEFYKIPDKVLEHIGFNPRSDAFNNDEEGADV